MNEHPSLAGVILAAGKGTRMKSELPKVLHSVCGLPMVEHVGRAMRVAGVERPIVVVGHGGRLLREALGEDAYAYAEQAEQLGTGHAAAMAAPLLSGYDGPVIVTPGDTPLLTGEALSALVARHRETEAAITLATFRLEDPTGYGRVVREHGRPVRIVEHKDASGEERAIDEVNAGVYCIDARALVEVLPRLRADNALGEYYLTDVLALLAGDGARCVAVEWEDPSLMMGVNDRWQLAEAAGAMRARLLRAHALAGVTIIDPKTTYVHADVRIEADTVLEPMTSLEGRTMVGAGCVIGPSARVIDSVIEDECSVVMSLVVGAVMRSGSRCGPFAHLRPGAVLGERAKVGNFVEVKNATLGEGSSASHLTYLGDAEIGPRVNVGAGTITCNYDGFAKHRTVIEEGAFVGSNSTLVAPVTIGKDAIVGAGSVITDDVPEDSLGLGRARQENKHEWAKSWRRKRQSGCSNKPT
jgi:bifunctional UDP-N-acetylglucosamine pyrophosphorylase/glucosamine-1-phosphate N-acetyltransferase